MSEFEAFVRNDETGEQEKVSVVGGPVPAVDGEIWVNTRTGEQFTVTAEPRESTLTAAASTRADACGCTQPLMPR